jgi:hypothetical protein
LSEVQIHHRSLASCLDNALFVVIINLDLEFLLVQFLVGGCERELKGFDLPRTEFSADGEHGEAIFTCFVFL